MCNVIMQFCYKCEKKVQSKDCFHGLHPECFLLWFGHASIVDFSDVSLKRGEDTSNTGFPSLHASFFHGKFKKYSAKLGDKSYILKVKQSEYAELPQIEYISNIIAEKLGLYIPSFYFIHFLNEMDTFVVHNFMENYHSANLIHLYHFLKETDEFSVRNILAIISDKVGRLDAIHQFIYMCLFDALIGNHDRHGRNIALIETKKGFLLSPFYDNPSYIGIEDHSLLLAHHNPRGKIATSSTTEPILRDYVQDFNELGYSSVVSSFLSKVQKIDFRTIIQKPFLSEKRQEAFLTLIKRRQEEFENALFC